MRNFIYFLTISILLVGCNASSSKSNSNHSCLSKDTSKNLETNLIKWNDILSQQQYEYHAYVYSETCYYCLKLKPFIEEIKKTNTVYYVEFNESIPIKNEIGSLKGVEDVNSLYILGTPTLFKIKDKKIEECLIGYNQIETYIKEI